ncbi:MAG: glycosyltransferase [Deltaproteobacteria bacterium]|nr:glycosyltransferase [Deltaproteobacteria bacterium]
MILAQQLQGPAESIPVLCVYGQQHVASIRDILIPALASQSLPAGRALSLHLVNYQNNQALFAEVGHSPVRIHDWSSARPSEHIGFGEGVNFLVQQAAPPECFFLVNPDSFPMEHCLEGLLARFAREEGAGIVEAHQWPGEHPKEYDAETLETPWASGAFSLISAPVFRALGGFDPVYFLYTEDVDLSWRVWLAGYRVIYEPAALAAHFTGLFSYRPDRFYHEHFFCGRNFLVISYKFFGKQGEAQALTMLKAAPFPASFKEQILTSYLAVKPGVIRYSGKVDVPQLKILGFNRFHELRTA